MKHKLITIRPTNGADLAPKDRIRLHGTLHDVIKGVHGEFYPCQKDIFEETYEEV